MTGDSPNRTFEYEMDGLTWYCDYFVKTRLSKAGDLIKILIVQLPNDGTFYANESAANEIVGCIKNKYKKNFFKNDALNEDREMLEQTIWNKLKPFDTFWVSWYGDGYDPQQARKTVLYHSDSNKLEVIMRMGNVAIEFSLQHSFPVASEDDFWD